MIRSVALRILRARGAPSRRPAAQARAIQEWVQSNVLYVNEPGDIWYDPLRTLFNGAGDCDDMAVLVASLLETLRIPSRLVVLRKGGRGYHVFVEVGLPPKSPTRWIPVETVLRVPMGWDPRDADPREIRKFV